MCQTGLGCVIHHACDCVEQELINLTNKVKELEKEVARLHKLLNEREQSLRHLLDCCYCNTGLCAKGRVNLLVITSEPSCDTIKYRSPK